MDRVEKLNWLIQEWLKTGFIYYDRREALKTSRYEREEKIIWVPSIALVAKTTSHFKQPCFKGDMCISGTCREIAIRLAEYLKVQQLVDSADVYGCCFEAEAHYIVILKIDSEEYLLDLGYAQPVPQLIKIGAGIQSTDFYVGEKSAGQMYAGDVVYCATRNGDEVNFLIGINSLKNPVKGFFFSPLREALDKQIILAWVKVTCNVYYTFLTSGYFQRIDFKDPAAMSEPMYAQYLSFKAAHDDLNQGAMLDVEYNQGITLYC